MWTRSKTKYKGVGIRNGGYIRARIMINGKEINLGHFPSLILAAQAYNEAAKNIMVSLQD